MSRFGMTGKIVAKADREQDPFTYIDGIRQEVFEIGEWRQETDKRLQILENAERDRLTRSGVWTIVKGKLDEEAVDWMKWGIRGIAAAAFMGLLSLLGLVLKFAWKGLLT